MNLTSAGRRLASVVGVVAVALAFSAMEARAQTSHNTCEADDGHACCVVRITIDLPGGEVVAFAEVGRIFPEWEAVERGDPDYVAHRMPNRVLEGTVAAPADANDTGTGPHVSFEDTPFAHDTHDFAFHVRPDAGYEHLLGTRLFNTCKFFTPEVCTPVCALEPPPDGFCPFENDCMLNLDNECVGFDGGPCRVCPFGCEINDDGICSKFPGGDSCENVSCDRITSDCLTEIKTQDVLEVEWENGNGADNNSNPCHSQNEDGNSCGFFSKGHRRRELIWNWPTAGDHVHVEGAWIFDRGHPPARSEIHPPRLVATQRRLPAMLPGAGGGFVIATRDDVFASGDGGALSNNRSGVPSYVRRVSMSEKDYSFKVLHDVPPPSSAARLRWLVVEQEGDNFPGDPAITQDTETLSDGTVRLLPSVTVNIPWQSRAISDTAVFARTIYVWWGTDNDVADFTVTHGLAADYRPRLFRVTLDYILMNDGASDMLEPGVTQGDMELRMFVDAGGNWLFVNELGDVDDVLSDGLGDAGDHTDAGTIVDLRGDTPQPWQFTLPMAPGAGFRLHAGGWEADGINRTFGELINPNSDCDCEFEDEFTGQFGIFSTYLSGGRDDAIGEVNHLFDCHNADEALGTEHAAFIRDQSGGADWTDDITDDTVHQNNVFRFQFHIQELSWQGAAGVAPPGGPCDTTGPAITITQPTAAQYVHSATLTLDYSAFDAGGSGTRGTTALMDGADTLAGHGLASGQAIDLLTEMTVGSHTFTVSATDYLGNVSSQPVTFEIIVTPESLIEDVKRFTEEGKITLDEGRSLLRLIQAAAAARAKGNCKNANRMYTAFINEVEAQSGDKIDSTAAQILIADATYLITHCP
jgi:hypothetical protein